MVADDAGFPLAEWLDAGQAYSGQHAADGACQSEGHGDHAMGGFPESDVDRGGVATMGGNTGHAHGPSLVTSGVPTRWVIDFQQMNILDAQSYPGPFKRIEEKVLPHIKGYADREREESGKDSGQDQTWLKTCWQHFLYRKEMVDATELFRRYIACPDTTKRPMFAFISSSIRPDHKLRVFAFEDDCSFGILQSHAHWLWFVTKCSKLTERFNYT